MIQLNITKTGKPFGSKEKYQIFDQEQQNFTSIQEAKAWVKETYGKSKQSKMFVDREGKATHTGYVIGFKNADWSHSPVNNWLQQDWIEFFKVEPIDLGKKEKK
jgi:hypothetical protein